jgi:toxin-antitoxin system PIN domain toxin
LIALPDINVLLALAWSNHPHHEAAHGWFAGTADNGWATCVLTQSGFLRLSMNPQVVGVALDCKTARGLLAKLAGQADHLYVDRAPALEGALFEAIGSRIVGYRQMSDATLVLIARAHGLQIVTFDRALENICPWPENVLVLPAANAAS